MIAWHRACSMPGASCVRGWAASLAFTLLLAAVFAWGPRVAGWLRLRWWLIQVAWHDDEPEDDR